MFAPRFLYGAFLALLAFFGFLGFELETQKAKESEKRQESAVEEARRKQREANCETARTNLKLIQQNSRIRIEEEGELRYLTPEEIEEQKQQFEKIAEENCGEPAEG